VGGARFRAEGVDGLRDRSSRPHLLHRPTLVAVIERVEACAANTGAANRSPWRSAPATVSRIPKRLNLNRLAALEPAEPFRRYERDKPGELALTTKVLIITGGPGV
jgi:hypothetical protein